LPQRLITDDRGNVERWIGFVFQVLKERQPEAVEMRIIPEEPTGRCLPWNAMLTLRDMNLFQASARALELAFGLGAATVLGEPTEPLEPNYIVAPETAPRVRHLSAPAPLATESLAPATKPKRSTMRGEAREKIIAALTEHHQYSKDSCLNTDPIGVAELGKKAKVSKSSVSEFFKVQFKGHIRYRKVCQDVSKLMASLKMIRGEYSPHILFGRTPPGEGFDDDE
jgi:hypothetical protein